jgi:2-dehydropantoate 2-reductase
MQALRIAVLGAGGVGGYFGGRLAAAGARVVFIARGAHLAALRRDGLRIESQLGDVRVPAADATDDPAHVGPVDLVIVAVKLYDTREAISRSAPLVGEATAVLTLQNGVDSVEELAAVFGTERVLGGVAKIGAVIRTPGIIRHTGTLATLVLGEPDGTRSERVTAIGRALSSAAIDHIISDDIRREIWDKMVFLATFSGLTTCYEVTAGELRADPARRARAQRCFAEAFAVANAHGAGLPEDTPDGKMQRLDDLPAAMVSSMLEDRRRGRRLELPWLSGAIVRLGAEKGLPTPEHAAIVRALEPFLHGAAGSPPAGAGAV